jgi:hypothetical protein
MFSTHTLLLVQAKIHLLHFKAQSIRENNLAHSPIWGITTCSIPDDHIDPRRFAFLMARTGLGDIKEDAKC